MKELAKQERGFTLIEMTMVLLIIIVLITLLMPSIRNAWDNVTKIRGLNNAREIVRLMQAMTFESVRSEYGPTWTYNVQRELMTVDEMTQYWIDNNIIDQSTLQSLMGAGDVIATHPFTAESIAWKILATADSALTQPVVISKNWEVDGLHEGPGLPYGKFGFVIAYKDGSAKFTNSAEKATDENFLGLAPQDFPEALR